MPARKNRERAGYKSLGWLTSLFGALIASSAVTGALAKKPEVINSKSKLLFCANGSIGQMPLQPPPALESQFAVAVVEIDSPRKLINAAVSDFVVFDQAQKATKLKRVVKVEEFDDYSSATQNDLFAHYMDGAKTRPWDGTLPAGIIRLRVRVALVDDPMAYPGRCRLTVGPYVIEGSLNGSWPTG